MRLRGAIDGRGAKEMLGEFVRDGRVRFEDERRILGHGLGVVLDATLSLALASVVLERELELAV